MAAVSLVQLAASDLRFFFIITHTIFGIIQLEKSWQH